MNISSIKRLVNERKIIWTSHIIIRLIQRNIKQSDVENALLNGEIIEEYPNDFPYPSYLVYGFDLKARAIHVVCGVTEDRLWIITAYYPSFSEWNNDLKTRKESK